VVNLATALHLQWHLWSHKGLDLLLILEKKEKNIKKANDPQVENHCFNTFCSIKNLKKSNKSTKGETKHTEGI